MILRGSLPDEPEKVQKLQTMAAFIGTLTALTRMHSLPCILMLYLFTIRGSCEANYEYRLSCRLQEEWESKE